MSGLAASCRPYRRQDEVKAWVAGARLRSPGPAGCVRSFTRRVQWAPEIYLVQGKAAAGQLAVFARAARRATRAI